MNKTWEFSGTPCVLILSSNQILQSFILSDFTNDTSNHLFSLAADFVNNTSRHVFLTGKAGTGKTTFLRHIRETTAKHAVVAAPTGVAAINAGGTTLHSLFQLPFGPFVPANNRGFGDHAGTDQNGLLKQLRLTGPKRELLQEMELLIIDEVSMMRADMLDAIDTILKSVRRNQMAPFGGVQVLYIGDLYQLPPVVPNDEWNLLSQYYESPFFFHARVIAQSPPLYIELQKIYRQNEQRFIDILNRIRNNAVVPEDLEELNSRILVQDEFESRGHTITLTTHNKKADAINSSELAKLPGKLHRFEGKIEKDFPEYALPTDLTLSLKVGAQVMFIKNDAGESRRFFNGKLAEISRIEKDEIYVIPVGETSELKLDKETWKNIRYNYNKEEDSIEEEELGSFSQFPIRLAWAITIHKSQGLTFEKAIIDAGQAFAPGQVYVALSRCTSLDGLQLSSKIFASAIQTNPQVIAFAQKAAEADELQTVLEKERKSFAVAHLFQLFEWKKLVKETEELKELTGDKTFVGKERAMEMVNSLLVKTIEQQEVANRFLAELRGYSFSEDDSSDFRRIGERLAKAIQWFCASLYDLCIVPLHELGKSLEGKSKVRTYLKGLTDLESVYWAKLNQLQSSKFPDFFFEGVNKQYDRSVLGQIAIDKAPKPKQPKGSSQKETLALFKSGMSISEIAGQRKLAKTTIEGHLAEFVLTGEIEPGDLLSDEKIKAINSVLDQAKPEDNAASLKQQLGDSYSYADLRVVINYRRRSTAKSFSD